MNPSRPIAAAALAAVVAVAAVLTAGHASAGQQRPRWGIGSALTVVRPTEPAPTPTVRPTATPTTPVPTPTVTPTPVASSTTTTAAPVAGMSLVHTYTFTGSTLDGDWGVYNTAYSSNPNARVPSLITESDGALHVTTSGDQGSGLCLCKGAGKPTVPYGRWDVRARVSANADHGFAMLLWPNAENWPVGGELDLAEFPDAQRSRLQTTVHYGATNQQHTAFTSGDFTAWHTYSVIWTPASVTYLVDDQPVMVVTDPAAIPSGPMHLALQAGPNSSTPSDTSASLDVAWVKVYR